MDVSELSDEDRKTVAEWWTKSDEPKPKEVSLGGSTFASVFPVFDPAAEGLEPRQVFCALAFQALASAIQAGLPGAEYEALEFLRGAGFEEAAAQEIVERMVARAPQPDPEDSN